MRISRLLLVSAVCCSGTCATRSLLLGDAERGKALFQGLNCIVCHSVNGVGRKEGTGSWAEPGSGLQPLLHGGPDVEPCSGDVGRDGATRYSQARRWTSSRPPTCLSFFYAASYFETPGDSKRGRQLFLARRCGQCHGIESSVRAGIRPVAEWESLWDPIALAQRMWNHSHDMASALDHSGVPYPLLSAQDLTDLLAWLRNCASRRAAPHGFAPASPETGQTLLLSKGCAGCHRGALTLESHRTRYGLTDFAAAMWNHPFRTGTAPAAAQPRGDAPPGWLPGRDAVFRGTRRSGPRRARL